ncbi:hypothetical protein [Sporanaerobacter sp. PP17-6a]|uniref:hypothetical protein n=1 Tax=Sporanaerobacter sp. PP17-6a TaxID=1891289 RepID=UPI0008A07395|nr:hypothetical protein [Sporanaerobacter sp. PP17-6a]SCL97011.1 hypothetical protein PP176A_3146 [Sporanaerobacter sp. PP17-6a]
MINNKLNFYFFGEIGDYDRYNPAYVCNKEYVPEILYIIASNEPYSISKYEIANILRLNEEKVDNIINDLGLINAIECRDNTYRTTFPVFLEGDITKMEQYLSNIGEVIGDKIISLQNVINPKLSDLECSKHYNKERILYHIICDDVFDDMSFDFFAERGIFCTSKIQPGNRAYIIIGYEDSKTVEAHSNKLLCSSNNYRSSEFIFNSFGDSNGSRRDMYRFFRMIEEYIDNATPFHDLNISYNRTLNDMNKEIAQNCGELIINILTKHTKYNQFSEREKNLLNLLKQLKYININEFDNSIMIDVPIFYSSEKTIIKDISDIILSNIFPIVREAFQKFQVKMPGLTALKHEVDIKEIANELWHQIFGLTNEYLVKKEVVSLPPDIYGEGRYLRSFRINSTL